ncbi:hypothetical protein QGN29_13165 [Temperatibacter marinus]|uniref:Uncharacterized protein n=1 Tax=Temperatibacter marinus TaxID=1456591 RepID=A0AA52H9G9_9PROT|nr:hypothetical protein [Temperatibacter marinus]WND02497.1 hypothetical protein QGN29_13165 [Temperatibacter marinus]
MRNRPSLALFPGLLLTGKSAQARIAALERSAWLKMWSGRS